MTILRTLFGTDGIRGEANTQLTPELALAVGRAAASYLGRGNKGAIVIGRDPRLSGAMLEAALAAGIASTGLDVCLAGIITTPGLAWAAGRYPGAVAGAMISASHNPMQDNGIKFVNPRGIKLEDDQELAIEELYRHGLDTLPRPAGAGVGRIFRDETLAEKYCDYLVSTLDRSLDGLRVVLDCANGAASGLGRQVLERCGARVDVINAEPDGININRDCGSTHPQAVAAAVKAGRYDLGLALDGDADRLIAVDARGNVVDGDQIMLICAQDLLRRGQLRDNTLVVSVMSNMGLHLAARKLGIKTVTTKVGDRYVSEAMLRGDYSLGGEQSGHIIFRRYATTGDGCHHPAAHAGHGRTGRSLEELAAIMERLLWVLHNVRVGTKEAGLKTLLFRRNSQAEAAAGPGSGAGAPVGHQPDPGHAGRPDEPTGPGREIAGSSNSKGSDSYQQHGKGMSTANGKSAWTWPRPS